MKIDDTIVLKELDQYYHGKEEPAKSCLLALRNIILAQDEKVTETRKYGMPCFCYGKKAFCYLWTDKKTGEPYILLVEGRQLNHPQLETGDRSRMKIFRINPDENIPFESIQSLLNAALQICRIATAKTK